MQNNQNFLQINSLGSADPTNLKIQTDFKTQPLPVNYTPSQRNTLLSGISGGITDVQNSPIASSVHADWDSSPNNPIIQGFQNLFSDPSHAAKFDHPQVQNSLFDIDNGIKGQAGVFRTPQQGLTSFGSDIDGKPLYAFDSIRNSDAFDLGKNKLYTAGSVIQQLGSFSDKDDADRFAKVTSLAGDPNFMGRIEGLKSQGDTKGAVNTIMNEFGYPGIDGIHDHDDPKRAAGLAFAAYNYAENAEKLSPAQKSLSLSTMALMSYKFKDGSDLSSKPIIKDEDGKTAFSVGNAMALAGNGTDIYSLQKNWDQIDALQRLTYGKGTASQMAATGTRMGLLGDPTMGGASVKHSEADLGKAGFTSIPSAGLGAITGNGQALPDGYEVVGAGDQPNQVIAVPKGLSGTTATINGSPEIRSLNAAPGVKKASTGAFKVASNWLPTGPQPTTARGTSFASGLGQSGALNDPYLKSAVATTSVYGNTVSKDQVGGLRRSIEDAALDYETGGISSKVQKADQVLTGGKGEALREKIQSKDPAIQAEDAIGSKVLSTGFKAADSAFGGKSSSQAGRDSVRALGVTNGLIDGKNWTVTNSDGTTADVGTDGHGGQHEFRFKDKDPNNINRSLNAYDVDYTNDLDFTANMMTSALTRMMAGGKGTPVDQFAGQLANASLGKVGFGQDMTEENFNYVRDNVRGYYFKKGIQTKEDAYALMNQMAGTSRITEMDQVAMQQGINLAFDDNAFDSANVLMAGRGKGLEIAGQIPQSPGPNFKFPADSSKAIPHVNTAPLGDESEVSTPIAPDQHFLKFDPGTYGGNANTTAFTDSIIKYQDQYNKARISR